MATEVYCKSDCQFAQNPERICSLKAIELTQTNPESALFNCAQYVRTERANQKFRGMDAERAKRTGAYLGLEEALNR